MQRFIVYRSVCRFHRHVSAWRQSLKIDGRTINQSGFTLIETLVAFMILAISLVVVMQLFSGGLKSNKLSADYMFGIFHAKEKMEELLLAETMVEQNLSGEFGDGYRWEASIVLHEPENETNISQPFSAFDITVDVIWQSGIRDKHFEVKTLKLAAKGDSEEQMVK